VDSYLQQLNRQFSGIDVPTDVLAFPDDGENGHIGDVIISAQLAAQSAQRRGHSTSDELQLLTVHGALHLLGHDHSTPEDHLRMWQAQAQILAQLGLSISTPTVASQKLHRPNQINPSGGNTQCS
jgi:probable rRNA maturation factor